MSFTPRDGFIGSISAAVASGVLLLSGWFGGIIDSGGIHVDSGGGSVVITAPSPEELSCYDGWTEVLRGVTHLDGVEAKDVGYVACDRYPYSLTRILGGGDQLTKAWGENVGWISDPEEVRRVVEGR